LPSTMSERLMASLKTSSCLSLLSSLTKTTGGGQSGTATTMPFSCRAPRSSCEHPQQAGPMRYVTDARSGALGNTGTPVRCAMSSTAWCSPSTRLVIVYGVQHMYLPCIRPGNQGAAKAALHDTTITINKCGATLGAVPPDRTCNIPDVEEDHTYTM
jgi:hypothetical protein